MNTMNCIIMQTRLNKKYWDKLVHTYAVFAWPHVLIRWWHLIKVIDYGNYVLSVTSVTLSVCTVSICV